jgi:ABC-type Fe3+/spermidine/putrescine transport system ATPase subunit
VERPLVEVRDVSLRLGDFAVHDASLDIARGEYFVLLGPTGAGKTVLLECVAGLHQPDRGDIYVDGERVNDMAPERRGLGYLPQDYALFPHLTVAQNIAFGLRIRRRPRPEIERTVSRLSQLVGIMHLLGRGPGHLSGGECQRVALARALAIEPKVLLLDEPLSALDEQTRENLCVELRRVHEELGTTTLHVSHNFEETLAVADRIGIIHQGRVRQIGTPDEVFRRPNSEFVAQFVRSENVLRGVARKSASGLAVTVEGHQFQASDGPEGDVYMTVRPEEVALSAARDAGRANSVVGRVARVVDKGALMRVEVEGKVTIVALVGRRSFQADALQPGDQVAASFQPDSVHVFPAA